MDRSCSETWSQAVGCVCGNGNLAMDVYKSLLFYLLFIFLFSPPPLSPFSLSHSCAISPSLFSFSLSLFLSLIPSQCSSSHLLSDFFTFSVYMFVCVCLYLFTCAFACASSSNTPASFLMNSSKSNSGHVITLVRNEVDSSTVL